MVVHREKRVQSRSRAKQSETCDLCSRLDRSRRDRLGRTGNGWTVRTFGSGCCVRGPNTGDPESSSQRGRDDRPDVSVAPRRRKRVVVNAGRSSAWKGWSSTSDGPEGPARKPQITVCCGPGRERVVRRDPPRVVERRRRHDSGAEHRLKWKLKSKKRRRTKEGRDVKDRHCFTQGTRACRSTMETPWAWVETRRSRCEGSSDIGRRPSWYSRVETEVPRGFLPNPHRAGS